MLAVKNSPIECKIEPLSPGQNQFQFLRQLTDNFTEENRKENSEQIIEIFVKHIDTLIKELATDPNKFEDFQQISLRLSHLNLQLPIIDRKIQTVQRIARIFIAQHVDMKLYENLSVHDINFLRSLNPPALKFYLMANLINHQRLPLNFFTHGEIMAMGPHLTYLDFNEEENLTNEKFNAILKSCPNVVELNMCGLDLVETIPPLFYCENLKCSSCKKLSSLSELPKCIFLDCGMTQQLTHLPQLPNCQTLICFNSQIVELPELPNCQKLDCSWSKMVELPELPNCQKINCNGTKIIELPELPNCISLSYSYTPVKKLPELPNCKTMEYFDCISLDLTTIPHRFLGVHDAFYNYTPDEIAESLKMFPECIALIEAAQSVLKNRGLPPLEVKIEPTKGGFQAETDKNIIRIAPGSSRAKQRYSFLFELTNVLQGEKFRAIFQNLNNYKSAEEYAREMELIEFNGVLQIRTTIKKINAKVESNYISDTWGNHSLEEMEFDHFYKNLLCKEHIQHYENYWNNYKGINQQAPNVVKHALNN